MGWIKNQIIGVMAALSAVEENALKQTGASLSDDTKMHQRLTQGTLMDSLINGEITEEVKLLRARLYKVTEAMDSMVIHLKYDENGEAVYEYEEQDYKTALSKLTIEPSDEYPPELVFFNKNETDGINDAANSFLSTAKVIDNPKFNPDQEEHDIDNPKTIVIGEVSNVEKKPLIILRDYSARFIVEKHISKVISRIIDSKHRLIELHIPKYPKAYNKNSSMFLKYFVKEMRVPEKSDLFEIKGLEFVTTNSTIGITHGILFEFSDVVFDKIVEFDGHYVIKYKTKILNVEDVKDYFKHEELDKLYETNAPRADINGKTTKKKQRRG